MLYLNEHRRIAEQGDQLKHFAIGVDFLELFGKMCRTI